MTDNGEAGAGDRSPPAGREEATHSPDVEEKDELGSSDDATTPTAEKQDPLAAAPISKASDGTLDLDEPYSTEQESREAGSSSAESTESISEDATEAQPVSSDAKDDGEPQHQRRPPPPSIRTEGPDDDRATILSSRSSASAARPPPTPAPPGTMVFVKSALENIVNSRDARRRKPLQDSAQSALAAIKKGAHVDPEDVFEPLRLATETGSTPLTTVALDCISKLITYSYFSMPTSQHVNVDPDKQPPPLIERAIDTICDCFQDEATTNEVQLQIVKSLLAAILNDSFIVHGAGLLKAIRQVYNIFLLSKSPANQQVAQGTLTQMVETVFERVKARLDHKEARLSVGRINGYNGQGSVGSQSQSHTPQPKRDSMDQEAVRDDDASEATSVNGRARSASRASQGLTLKDFENAKTFDDNRIADNAPTMVTRVKNQRSNRSVSGLSMATDEKSFEDDDDEDEVFVKDAFLVFRSMCRLSMKQNTAEQLQDPKTQHLRSKLIALAIIRSLLNNHMEIFISPLVTITGSTSSETTSFGTAVNQYLRLVVGRNGPSSVKQVFETTCEIFWLILKDMRVPAKREIEVFLKEIYLSILERRNVPNFQKLYLLRILRRLSEDPKALVEMYLNYDCDRTALDNMFQRVIELMSRLSSTPVSLNPQQQVAGLEQSSKDMDFDVDWRDHGRIPPPLTTMALQNVSGDADVSIEVLLKQGSLGCLIRTLRSLRDWSQDRVLPNTNLTGGILSANVGDDLRVSVDGRSGASPRLSTADAPEGPSTPAMDDDPGEFEKAKARKTALTNDIRQFNFKPKRGIKALLQDGFIPEDTPRAIAIFLLENDQVDKAAKGEYLGEGDDRNIEIMHEFVNLMDFENRRFVDSLRQFLQSFRLPGEAQKIDRFMLKFAERYIAGNPNAFANADTAYILAYSVVLLNTDQHSKKMKDKRMTHEDFIKNNRGINDGGDLPEEYLRGIYDEIQKSEIVLETEQSRAAAMGIARPADNSAQQADVEMSSKAEERLKNLLKAQRRLAGSGRYIEASSSKHVGPMFDATWMSFLSGLSAQMQTTHNLNTVKTCMEGIRLAIHISCLFDVETARDAFVGALANATNLGNLREMMAKNLEALKMLLEVAVTEGNMLKGSWSSILTCVSQLDRFQLMAGGVDEEYVPDMRKLGANRNNSGVNRRSTQQARPSRQRTINPIAQTEIAQEARSSEMTRNVDRIFSGTQNLRGDAIVHFVKALCEVSWQEMQSSGGSETPRMYSLQKLVEISYYNMNRVRFEWTNIWLVLGDHFNEVACQGNTNVVFFALDSLRQLSMRFMEIAELPNFQFQKDFLKPFKHVMHNSTAVNVKDMVLRCLVQMIDARGENIRSGWKTIFGVFGVAAKEPYEALVETAFTRVQQIYDSRFAVVISQGAFPDFVVCLTEFSKNTKFQKKALNALETLKATIPRMLKVPTVPIPTDEKSANGSKDTTAPLSKFSSQQAQQEQFWFPVLFAFHDILMTGEDLEVRSQALNYLFDTLVKYGKDFPPEFWDVLWRQLLYPIFMVLKSKQEMSKAPNHEDLSVWLSTTMIQALRSMIALFTHYFENLEYMLDRFLDLLALCICQENDTIARIGSNCLQTLILQNVDKFNAEHWHQIVSAFVTLFDKTTAHQLFTAATTVATPQIGDDEEIGDPAQAEEVGLALTEQAESPPENPEPNSNGASAGKATNASNGEELISPRTAVPPTAGKAAKPAPVEDFRPQSMQMQQQQPVVVTAARRRFFNRIITRCVLQLLMIETVNELFSNSEVYAQIPSPELLRLMALLKKSYGFAKKFNNDKELRMRLWHEGFMKQPPNLLKQESGSAATYVSILVRMYFDDGEERRRNRVETEAALIPLCADIISSFTALDEETQQRNIVAWRPVVVDVMEAYMNFPATDFEKHIETFYPLSVDLLGRDIDRETRLALQGLLKRIGEVRMGMPPYVHTPLATPTSPRSIFARRPSRVASQR